MELHAPTHRLLTEDNLSKTNPAGLLGSVAIHLTVMLGSLSSKFTQMRDGVSACNASTVCFGLRQAVQVKTHKNAFRYELSQKRRGWWVRCFKLARQFFFTMAYARFNFLAGH